MKKELLVFVDQSVGYISIDIINEFAQQYKKVVALAGTIRVQDRSLSENVQVRRLFKYKRTSFLNKFFSWSVFAVQVFYFLFFHYRNADVFFTTKPPFPTFFGLISKHRFAVQVMDVYPDILQVYGISESNILYKLWAKFNKRIFKKAIKVYTISSRMKSLIKKYTDEKKIEIVHLWGAFNNSMRIDKSENKWLHDMGLNGHFIVQYSGNIGYAHNVEILLEIASQLKNEKLIKFLIIGRGERYSVIKDLILKRDLNNCLLLPFQPDNVLEQSLSAADLGVVLLEEKVADVSLPSKIYNLQRLGIPLLCFAPPTSEMKSHLDEFKCGVCYKESEIEKTADFILKCAKNPALLDELSRNSLLAGELFTYKNARNFTLALISR